VSFVNTDGKGIEIQGAKNIGFNAHHQYNDDFDAGEKKNQTHATDIVKRDLVNINIDYKQMGVGGDTSWGRMPHDTYQIQPSDLSFSYVIRPLR
jgi:beta-galactosidase